MTAIERACKAVEARVAADTAARQQRGLPTDDGFACGRIACPVCKTHTLSFESAPDKPIWVACNNPECEVMRELRAALKEGSSQCR